jgi:hypothetical protein
MENRSGQQVDVQHSTTKQISNIPPSSRSLYAEARRYQSAARNMLEGRYDGVDSDGRQWTVDEMYNHAGKCRLAGDAAEAAESHASSGQTPGAFRVQFVRVPTRWRKAVYRVKGPRFKKQGRVHKSQAKKQRLARKYGLICAYCGSQFETLSQATLDHVIPAQLLRHDKIWNLVLACEDCNSAKDNKIPAVLMPLLSALVLQLARLNAVPVERSLVPVGGVR